MAMPGSLPTFGGETKGISSAPEARRTLSSAGEEIPQAGEAHFRAQNMARILAADLCEKIGARGRTDQSRNEDELTPCRARGRT